MAYQVMQENPNFGHDAVEAIINDCPDLAQALVNAGLAEEVTESED